MLDRLSRLPQFVFMTTFLISLAFMISFGATLEVGGLNDTSADQLPWDYWLVLVLALLSFPVFIISIHYMNWAGGRTISAMMAILGTGALGLLLFNIRGGWRAVTLTDAIACVFFYSLAFVFRLLERQRRSTSEPAP